MEKPLIFILLLLQMGGVYPICRPMDDAAFMGIFGKIYIREQHCTDVDFTELRDFIAGRPNTDGLYFIEDSNIGSIKTELVAPSKANMVITFSCINCQIKEIEKEGLKKLVKLYNLTLVGNDFGSFDGTSIKNDNLRFQHLNLTGNNLKKVENICLGIPTMKTIVLKDNPIENLDPNIFKSCKNLLYLDISNTSIKLTQNMFANNSKLDELHLSNLKLGRLEEYCMDLPNLTYLDLSGNDLTTLDTKLFDYYKSLRILDLSGNKIGSIVHQGKGAFPLRQLYLQKNNITNISIINLEYFKEIQRLDLSFNQIREVPVHFFEHSTELRHVILANNFIQKLSVGTFSPVGNLIHLDISYNNFSSLDENLLHSLPSLEELHVSGNNLTTFEPYQLGSMISTLKRLGISDLNWKCETLTYIVRFCKSHNMDCLPKGNKNFKTSNVDGISCSENKTENKWTPISAVQDKLLNLTRDNILEQNKILQSHLNQVGSINAVLVFISILFLVFVVLKVVLPIVKDLYVSYKQKGELLNSNHLNISHMELVQNNVYGQA